MLTRYFRQAVDGLVGGVPGDVGDYQIAGRQQTGHSAEVLIELDRVANSAGSIDYGAAGGGAEGSGLFEIGVDAHIDVA